MRVFLFCFARFPPKFVFCFLLAICSSSCVFFLPIRSCPFLACACRFLTVAWVAAAELSFAHIFFYFAVRTPLTNMCGAQAHIPHTTLSKKHTHTSAHLSIYLFYTFACTVHATAIFHWKCARAKKLQSKIVQIESWKCDIHTYMCINRTAYTTICTTHVE